MSYDLEKNNNNSKKLIIGVSIIFCAVILIIGGTFAFFTQTDSKELGNIVSSNDNNAYINYIEEKSMMLDNLIPMKSEDIEKALFRGNTCVDDNGYNVCSAYMFSLENTYGEVQKINISMIPTANSFTNLKYMVVKMGTDGMPTFITEKPLSLEKNNLNPITLIENEILYSGQDNIGTYAILFYIESMDYDQTKEDAGKHFGASIKIDSITTGKYITKTFGDSCWDLELVEGTIDEYKLTKFNGIDNSVIYDSEGNSTYGEDKGVVKEECEMYATKDGVDGYYTINIPSSVGGHKITTLGSFLFYVFEIKDNSVVNKINSYRFIKQVNIGEGIKIIEDGVTFGYVGIKEDSSGFMENFETKINLPNTLEYIGDGTMSATSVYEITIPKSAKQIGNTGKVFGNLTNITFEGAEDNTSNLQYIGSQAFYKNGLTEVVIPSSVVSIGTQAFASNDLTQITLKTEEDGTSSLREISGQAFEYNELDYQDRDNPLVIPPTVTYIGNQVFWGNNNLKFIKYTGTNLSSFGNSWNGSAEIIRE